MHSNSYKESNLSENDKSKLVQIEAEIERLELQKAQLLQQHSKHSSVHYACIKSGNRNVVIVGGKGQLGSLFVRLFSQSGYLVNIIEANDWKENPEFIEKLLKQAALVLVAVPIHFTSKVIEQLKNLPTDCVLADITSIKTQPLKKMLESHKGSVVGLHPMFGPGVSKLNKQTIVMCHGRNESEYDWIRQQLLVWQVNVYTTSAQKHDEAMAIVQVLRHFSTVAYGAHLAHEDVCLQDVLAMSSPIYRLELAMVGRLFAQNPELYTEIIFANPDNLAMMQRYIKRFSELLETLASGDKAQFMHIFANTREWFGDYADKFLKESSQMLAAANKES